MIKYSVKTIKLKTKEIYLPEFIDSQYEILTDFLSGDFKSFKKSIYKAIDTVISGKEQSYGFAGNSCSMDVTPDTVRIQCEIDGADIGEPVEVPIMEFKELLDDWSAKLKELKSNK